MTPEPRTPLTLEFEPDNIVDPDTPEDFTPIVVCEPSFTDPGRIYLGVNPVGHRLGVHFLPDEARRVRDHLTKLLLEPPDIDAGAVSEAAPAEGLPVARVDYKPETVQDRLNRAVERLKTAKPVEKAKTQWLQFRLEFKIGDIQGVIGRLPK